MAVTHCCIFSKERFGQWHGAGGWGSGRYTAPHFPMAWSSDYNPALIYYCTHPLLYAVDDRKIFILKSQKTYAVMLLCVALFDPDTDAGAVK